VAIANSSFAKVRDDALGLVSADITEIYHFLTLQAPVAARGD